ncbi:MAG: flavin reductase family protein [Candidatus Bathyarchaeia archaeon]
MEDVIRLSIEDFYKIVVRPTVVISTISPGGVSNAAPFSFNSPVTTGPVPLYGFCCETGHDTWRNIKENGEFVVNLVGDDFGPLMHIMERDLPYEVSEIEECGLIEAPSNIVKAPRIAESYGWIECKMREYVQLSQRAVWIIGKVLDVGVKEEVFEDNLDVDRSNPLMHLEGEIFVTEMREKSFERS